MSREPLLLLYGLSTVVGLFLAELLKRYAPSMGLPLIDSSVQLSVLLVSILVGVIVARRLVTSPKTLEEKYTLDK